MKPRSVPLPLKGEMLALESSTFVFGEPRSVTVHAARDDGAQEERHSHHGENADPDEGTGTDEQSLHHGLLTAAGAPAPTATG